jgi:hypothetical protein
MWAPILATSASPTGQMGPHEPPATRTAETQMQVSISPGPQSRLSPQARILMTAATSKSFPGSSSPRGSVLAGYSEAASA